MFLSKVGRGDSGALPDEVSSSQEKSFFSCEYTSFTRVRVCVPEGGRTSVPTVPTVPGFSYSIFTPHSSARWKAVPMCTSLCPVFSALLNSCSAARWSYFDERLHRARKS